MGSNTNANMHNPAVMNAINNKQSLMFTCAPLAKATVARSSANLTPMMSHGMIKKNKFRNLGKQMQNKMERKEVLLLKHEFNDINNGNVEAESLAFNHVSTQRSNISYMYDNVVSTMTDRANADMDMIKKRGEHDIAFAVKKANENLESLGLSQSNNRYAH